MDQYLGSALVMAGAFLAAIYNSWKGKLLKKDADGNQTVSGDVMMLVNMLGSGALMIAIGQFLPTANPAFFKTPGWLLALSASLPIWAIALIATGVLNIGIQSLNNAALTIEKTSLINPLASATPRFFADIVLVYIGTMAERLRIYRHHHDLARRLHPIFKRRADAYASGSGENHSGKLV